MPSDSHTTKPKRCDYCEGRGWVGDCTGGQFAAIGRLALMGRLPTKECHVCEGTGHV